MAKTTLNSALSGIRGRIDNWVYRKFGDKTVIARRPEFHTPASAAQVAVRERFLTAAAYARTVLADPVLKPLYAAAAKTKGIPLWAFALGDYLKPPVVHVLDAAGYHGQAGDLIKVIASDDFEVASVGVVIRDAADAVLEEGPAALNGGTWTYAATQAVAAGETVTIEATAKDRPGNTHGKIMPLLIG